MQEVSLVDPALVVTLLERREEEPMGQVRHSNIFTATLGRA